MYTGFSYVKHTFGSLSNSDKLMNLGSGHILEVMTFAICLLFNI